jgi:DNA-binding LacI/PurR family transcriptional regulator
MTVRSVKRRVGLLMDAIEDQYQAGIVRGVAHAIGHANIALVCVAGGVVGNPAEDHRCARNFLFDLVDPTDYDGFLVLSGALGSDLGVASFSSWLERFRGKPVVALGAEGPGFPSIAVDGGVGMRAIVSHVVEAHGRRRVGFVRGPETNVEAEERLAAYRAVLQENGIPVDARFIVQGTWLRESGAAAVRELLDTRGLGPRGLDAIVFANDYMALGGMDELRERGIDVPGDVAVAGFDDLEASRSMVPPLTTVRQPVEALGREGVRHLVSLMNLNDETAPPRLPAEVALRRSCGCARARPSDAPPPPRVQRRSFEAAFMERRAIILAEMARAAQGAFVGAGNGWEERLSTALVRDASGRESWVFATTLDQTLVKVQRAGGDITVATAILNALRRAVHACATAEVDAASRAEEVLDVARDLIGEWLLRAERLRTTEIVRQVRTFTGMASQLLAPSHAQGFRGWLEERLRGLGLPAASIGLFAEPGRISEECVSLVGYTARKSFARETRFRARDMGHVELRGVEEPLLVQPLVCGGEALGIATLPWGVLDEAVYEQAREILGTGAKGFMSRGWQGVDAAG